MPCARSDDALLDAEDWAFTLTLTDPETGLPRDVTGSAFRLELRAALDGELVGVASTAAGDGSLVVVDGQAGKVAARFPAVGRTWRAPASTSLALTRPVTIVGDLLRRPAGADAFRIEGAQRITLLVRPSTTRWPDPT